MSALRLKTYEDYEADYNKFRETSDNKNKRHIFSAIQCGVYRLRTLKEYVRCLVDKSEAEK